MKIELDQNLTEKNRIDAYSNEAIRINNVSHEKSIIVTPEEVITWTPQTFSELDIQHIQILIDLKPEVLLLGTGLQLRFPNDKLLSPLYVSNIGFEVMDTGAACRAYNFLVGEGREVVAALLMIRE